MTLRMLGNPHLMSTEIPGNPASLLLFTAPMTSLSFLLCAKREELQGKPTSRANNCISPRFGVGLCPVDERTAMTSSQFEELKKNAASSIRFATRVASIYTWIQPLVHICKALVKFGTGGSAETSIRELEVATAAAEHHKGYCYKGMAHLYRAILMHKAGRNEVQVDKELRAALQEELAFGSPSHASKIAHMFLGTEEKRHEYMPRILFDGKTDSTAHSTDKEDGSGFFWSDLSVERNSIAM